MISELIDKQDNSEVVRDQIAAILALEVASQMGLATAGGKDPDDWKLRVYLERSNTFGQFLNPPVTDESPLVNIWYDNSNFNENSSNVAERQHSTTIYNIDCYGYGKSRGQGAGHIPGDLTANLEVQRALRLVRNILMAAEYTYLGLRGTVWGRWPQSITPFEVQLDSNTVEKVVGARIALRVDFNEFSPQIPLETLELLTVQVLRAEDGQVMQDLSYVYPL